MYRSHSSNQSFIINQPIPVPFASYTDEELSISQQRFQNFKEMREAIMIEIEKEKRRNREITLEINRMERESLPLKSEYELIGPSISPPVLRRFVPPRDGEMSLEEKLARNCEEKRLVEKAVAARTGYGG